MPPIPGEGVGRPKAQFSRRFSGTVKRTTEQMELIPAESAADCTWLTINNRHLEHSRCCFLGELHEFRSCRWGVGKVAHAESKGRVARVLERA
jgi:hypothetical protein